MSRPIEEAGNKASLRAGTGDNVHRINIISSSMGKIADTVISTNKSMVIAAVAVGVPVIAAIALLFSSIAHLGIMLIPLLLVIVGAVLLGLNFLFINPSQGMQAVIGLRYWRELINGQAKRYLRKNNPYRFVKSDPQKASLEGMYRGRRRYLCIVKVHGSVTQTAFDEDLIRLRDINYASIRALDRTVIRTTVNKIGVPKVEPKQLAANQTRGMKLRQQEIIRGVRNQGRIQTIDTYILLDAPSWQDLQKKLANQYTYWNNGLVVTTQLLKGDQLKKTMLELFA